MTTETGRKSETSLRIAELPILFPMLDATLWWICLQTLPSILRSTLF
jgi:hypothetical protein